MENSNPEQPVAPKSITAKDILNEVLANSPLGPPKVSEDKLIMLQIKLLQIPKRFNDVIQFRIITSIPKGERIMVELYDIDSIFSNEPSEKNDTLLFKGYNTISELSVFNFTLNSDMEKKAFEDVEFTTAECYLKISHPRITDVYSSTFNVGKIVTQKTVKEEEECVKVSVSPIHLDNSQKIKFISTVLAETSFGHDVLKDIAWVYFNLVSAHGFEEGLKRSNPYKYKDRNYKLSLYYLGEGDIYKRDYYEKKTTMAEYAKKDYFTKYIEPDIKTMKAFIEKEIFSKTPKTCFKGWEGQGFFVDLDYNPIDGFGDKWYKARQYYWMQLEHKVSTIYIKVMRDQRSTSFIFDEISIGKYFDKNPSNLPAPENVRKFYVGGILNVDL